MDGRRQFQEWVAAATAGHDAPGDGIGIGVKMIGLDAFRAGWLAAKQESQAEIDRLNRDLLAIAKHNLSKEDTPDAAR